MAMNSLLQGNPPAHLLELERKKSSLLFEAQLLKGQQQYAKAADKFVQVADIERQWAEWAEKEGLNQLTIIHRYSELSCWAQAGNPYQALRLIDHLLASAQLSPEQRADLEEYQASLHYQFMHWMGEWSSASVPVH
ncbi:MAG: hypothetical protein KC423_26680 [Anaerolineales bacterium]|nr:hypothetical protein [Anaerolineales bacterium]